MRVMILFDLPTESAEDRRNYRRFRRDLIKAGFYMLQESIYCKMTINALSAKFAVEQVRRVAPPKGLVNALVVTEKQFAEMEYIVGDFETDVINTDERTVFL